MVVLHLREVEMCECRTD